jgi:hypothetical protein
MPSTCSQRAGISGAGSATEGRLAGGRIRWIPGKQRSANNGMIRLADRWLRHPQRGTDKIRAAAIGLAFNVAAGCLTGQG